MQRDLTELIETSVESTRPLEEASAWLKNLSTRLFLESPFRPIKTFLNGTWLEHPLHPVLTDVPVGAWTMAMLFDVLDALKGKPSLGQASGISTGAGVLAGTATIITGLMDYTDADPPEVTVGFLHGITNIVGTLLFAVSFLMRWRNGWRTKSSHLVLSGLGYGIVTFGAYLGGSLVFRQGVMVNRNAFRKGPRNFTRAIALAELPENQLRKIEVMDQPILLLRRGEQVYAIGAVCSHYGAPLEKGKLLDDSVQCPWHYSIYSLKDGRYLQGPTTAPVPAYDVRISNGQVEVKMRK